MRHNDCTVVIPAGTILKTIILDPQPPVGQSRRLQERTVMLTEAVEVTIGRFDAGYINSRALTAEEEAAWWAREEYRAELHR